MLGPGVNVKNLSGGEETAAFIALSRLPKSKQSNAYFKLNGGELFYELVCHHRRDCLQSHYNFVVYAFIRWKQSKPAWKMTSSFPAGNCLACGCSYPGTDCSGRRPH